MSKNASGVRENANPPEHGVDLRWDDLSVVLALIRAGTLSGAATRLGVNVSTVGRRIDAIEAQLGVHLFDRTSTGVGPTELAEALIPIAETMEQSAAAAMRILAGRETEPEGVVRLAAPPGLASWMIAPALVELRRRYPKIILELDASVAYVDLTRREADLALRSARPQSGDLTCLRLIEAAPVVTAAPQTVAAIGTLRDLDDVDWVTWGSELAHLPDRAWIAKHVDPARVVLRTNSLDAQIQAVRVGIGVMLLHGPFLPFAGLSEVPLSASLVKRVAPTSVDRLWLVGHRALRDVPRVKAVWDFMVELFEPSPSRGANAKRRARK